jgi:hypothetical protein
MAACAWNLRKWLAIATIFLFWQKLGLFFVKHRALSLHQHSLGRIPLCLMGLFLLLLAWLMATFKVF